MSKKKKRKPTSLNPIPVMDDAGLIAGSEALIIKEDFQPAIELIRFDRKTNLYLIVFGVLFIIFVSFKLHNSSIPWWNSVINDGGDPSRGLLAGKPLGIRSDEWLVSSSFTLAQYQKGFPVSNEPLGYGKTPLVWNLPTNHLTSKITPSLWGYYFLDIERAFSWNWSFKVFPFLISSFLLLMLFTRNNFMLSLFGSIWLLLSSAIQWWSINTELFTYSCFVVISFLYILFYQKPWIILANGVLLLISMYSFALYLYPAYQVPLAYFLLALIMGFMIKYKSILKIVSTERPVFKIVTLSFVLTGLFYFIYLFYDETKDTIEVLTNTVYPGDRSETGGNYNFIRMFTDNFSWFMTETSNPPGWMNISELSTFLMLSPIASVIIIIDFIRTRKIDALLCSVLVFQLIVFIWMFAGFPDFLANLSFLKTSPPNRTFFILGFSNVVAVILFLAHHKTSFLKSNMVTKIISFIILFIFSFAINYFLNKDAGFFFQGWQVWIATIVFACLTWLVIYFRAGKFYKIGFYILGIAFFLPNLIINPLSKGLAPYFENKYFNAVYNINLYDQDAGWVVFGPPVWGNFLKAAGINCFSGVQFAPPLEKLHVLDPLREYDQIYNRYAHISFLPFRGENDEVKFSLIQTDHYLVQMDPCSPRFKQLGIKYFLFNNKPMPDDILCMTKVINPMGLIIYKRSDY